jgi:predicted amidohydrolase YtcJ
MAAETPGILRCRVLWPGRGTSPLEDARISMSRGRITSVTKGSGWRVPFAMPSFVDAHCHVFWTGFSRIHLDLSSCRSAGELLSLVGSGRATGRVLRGEGWDDSTWYDRRLPTLEEMDSAAGGRAVFLRRVCGHAALVSSATIAMLEREGALSGPAGVRITEGPVLHFDEIVPPGRTELLEAFGKARDLAFAEGVTGLRTLDSAAKCSVLSSIADAGLRVSMAVWAENMSLPEGLSERFPDGLWGVKVFLDGGIGAATAAMSSTFEDGSHGSLLYSDEQLADLLSGSSRAGLRVAAHAIGGAALRQLDRVCAGLEAQPAPAVTVEHAEELQADWPGRWDRGRHAFSMQPNFVRRWQGDGGLYDIRLGSTRAAGLNPFRLPVASGFELGFGSDGMPFGPLWGIPGAVEHRGGTGLDLGQALGAYTAGSAIVAGFPELAAPISAGRPADLVVLSADPFEVGIREVKVVATIIEGEVVWGDPGILEEG